MCICTRASRCTCCSAGCKAKFAADPAKYLAKATAAAARFSRPRGARAGGRRRHLHLSDASGDPPGSSRRTARNAAWRWSPRCRRLDDERQSGAGRLPAALLVDVAADGCRDRAGDVRPSPAWIDMATQSWVELVLAPPVVLWAGWPFFERGWQSVVNRSPNMWTLIGLGTGAAFVYSVVATVAPQVFPGVICFDGARGGLLRGGGGHHLADAAGPAPGTQGAIARPRRPSSRCSVWRPRPRGGSTPTAARRMCRWPCARRRPLACRARREGAGGRRGHRRQQRRR